MLSLDEIRIVERAWHKAQLVYRQFEPDAPAGESWAEFEALQDLLDTQLDDDRNSGWV